MSDFNEITGRQLAAARALVGIGQVELATNARVSAPTLRRMESSEGTITGMANNVAAIIAELERLGVEFFDGDYTGSGGPGVRLRKP